MGQIFEVESLLALVLQLTLFLQEFVVDVAANRAQDPCDY